MANAPITTGDPSPQPDDPRYPRPTWLRAIRWLFLHWWLIPLTCAIILILTYLLDMPSINQLLPFLIQYWWILTLSLIVVIFLLRGAYTWANSDNTSESIELHQRRQRELEQQLPPPGFKLHHTFRGHTERIAQIAWSPDGRLLASASGDRTVRLWDAQTAHLLHTLSGHSNWVWSVAWSPDGRLLASASDDCTIRLWDAATGRQTRTLESHTGPLSGIAFSADNRLLASKSIDATVRLWNLDVFDT